jgi:hypothetical protein
VGLASTRQCVKGATIAVSVYVSLLASCQQCKACSGLIGVSVKIAIENFDFDFVCCSSLVSVIGFTLALVYS